MATKTPTPDLSEFLELKKRAPRPQRPCAVAAALQQLTVPADKVNITAALAAPKEDIPQGAIVKWFKLREITVNHTVIQIHRAKRCACAKSQ